MNSSHSAIQNQVRLPIRVAWGVVVQGIRIRLGRSMVTLSGVVLGVAFLMSILSADFIKSRAAGEIDMRQTVAAMLGFLLAETGPLAGRSVAVHQSAEPDTLELRLLEELRRLGVGSLPAFEKLNEEAVAVVVLGPDLPGTLWNEKSGFLRQRIAAFTREPAAPLLVEGTVRLRRPPTAEDIARAEEEAAQARVRTIWIVAIAVLVTVISISNALLMSVTERFREIGTMKCLGALSSFIRQVFFLESALIGLVGSIAGALFGLLFALVLYGFSFGWGLVFGSLPVAGLVSAFFICTVGGVIAAVVAAIYPASFASRMVPATALRTNI
jgi:hypothetical protein